MARAKTTGMPNTSGKGYSKADAPYPVGISLHRDISKGSGLSSGASRARQQRLDALKRANEVRTSLAMVKRHLHEQPGRPEALALLADVVEQMPSDAVRTLRVDAALKACQGCGIATCRSLCREARVRPTARLGELVGSERLRLVWTLREWSWRAVDSSVRRHRSVA